MVERVIAQNLHSQKLLQYRGVDKLQFAASAVHGKNKKRENEQGRGEKIVREGINKMLIIFI